MSTDRQYFSVYWQNAFSQKVLLILIFKTILANLWFTEYTRLIKWWLEPTDRCNVYYLLIEGLSFYCLLIGTPSLIILSLITARQYPSKTFVTLDPSCSSWSQVLLVTLWVHCKVRDFNCYGYCILLQR